MFFRICEPEPAIGNSNCNTDTDCPDRRICINGVCMHYPRDVVEPTIKPAPIMTMCFLPGRMVQRSRPLIDIHIVKCEPNEDCVKAWTFDSTNVGGEDLG